MKLPESYAELTQLNTTAKQNPFQSTPISRCGIGFNVARPDAGLIKNISLA